GAFDDRGVVLIDGDLLGPAQVFELKAFELDAEVFTDQRAAGQDGDVAEHRLAAVAKTRGFHRTNVEDAAQLIDDEKRQRFGIDIFGDDQERLAALRCLFQDWHQIAKVADFLFVYQDQAV